MYEDGHGVAQNYREAAKWYRLAAEQGIALAQFNLGLLYENGQGVPQNSKEAVKWFRLAADKGMRVHSSIWAAICHQGHEGIPQDYKEAMRCTVWLRNKASRLRSAPSATMYHSAKALRRTTRRRAVVPVLAAEQGDAPAQRASPACIYPW